MFDVRLMLLVGPGSPKMEGGGYAKWTAQTGMSTAVLDRDPVLAALPAEVRDRVERGLQAYEKKDGSAPSTAFGLWPEIPGPGEQVVAPPMPKQPPRQRPGEGYRHGSQPNDWVARSIAQSVLPRTKVVKAKPLPPRPAWESSPSGRWRTTLHDK